MSEVVIADGLTRTFGSFTAVDNVSFSVRAGEIFGFLGPNGAGKTSTIRMLSGLLAPSAGRASVAGHDAAAGAPDLRRAIGYMSQAFSLYGDLTVAENIELFAGLYGVTGAHYRRRRAWVLAMAGLDTRADALTLELPLGYKQRLALGCAVLHEPPVLFLDEPTSGVDPLARRAFWDLIHALAASGTTILVSTHYMEEAEYCHRLILMNRGRIIAAGAPSELRGSFRGAIWEIDTPDAAAAVQALTHGVGGDSTAVDAAMFGRSVHLAVDAHLAVEPFVSAALSAAELGWTGIRQVEPTLEDVFVALVRRGGGAAAG
jgi:ABC-2 type transport system ATP-binding protein